MTDSMEYPASSARLTDVQINFRDGVSQTDREMAERSVAAMIARHTAAVAQTRAADAETKELTDAVNAPLVKLIQQDPDAARALETLRTRQRQQSDVTDALREEAPAALSHDAFDGIQQAMRGMRSLGFVPPYDFSWSWHVREGFPPGTLIIDRPSGRLALSARTGPALGGVPGFINAHAGFGVFLRSDVTAQKYPHAILNPGWFHYSLGTSLWGDATSEGGFELTVFENGQFLVAADQKLWRRRISNGEHSSLVVPDQLYAGPELQFTQRGGVGYTFNAGIWVYSDYSDGIDGSAALSELDGRVTWMWVAG